MRDLLLIVLESFATVFSMSQKFDLSQMSVPEKMALMEALWKDLSGRVDDLQSPAWHGPVLEERRRKAANGDEKFTDWASAKEEIRRKVS
jgi:hypothetical protein